jgi:hypothetical protein
MAIVWMHARAGFQRPPHDAAVRGPIALTDRLEPLDRRDAVVAPGDVALVLKAQACALGEPDAGDVLACVHSLRIGQANTGDAATRAPVD